MSLGLTIRGKLPREDRVAELRAMDTRIMAKEEQEAEVLQAMLP